MDRVSMFTPRTDVAEETTSARPTPKSGVSFRDVVTRSASSLVQGAQSMVTRLPGGPMLAAAVHTAPTGGAPGGGLHPSLSPNAPLAAGGGASSATASTSSNVAEGPGAGSGGDAPPIESTLAQSQDMNLYYLQLQEQMAAENRAYTACSNVLKARHDTVKNAIGNIR